MYYIYMLRCRDNSLYCGISPDIAKRMKVHFEGGAGSSKYVCSKGAVKLEVYWESKDKSAASKLEYRLKKLPKDKKEALILDAYRLDEFLSEKIDCGLYVPGNMQDEALEKFTGLEYEKND